MSILRTTLVFLLIWLVVPVALEQSSGNAQRPQVGDRFPVLILPSLGDESPSSIAQFRGRKLLLHQFASW